MCGITGIVHPHDGPPVDASLLRRMNDSLFHRGPDEEGFWCDGTVGLAMRRLSILDLEGGTQPKQDESGRFQLVFNGEIYNHAELRADLAGRGRRFSTHSDTEVLAQLLGADGADAWSRLDGMFAVAAWDRQGRSLLLARDPFGVKPLFYSLLPGGGLAFASEIRALLAHPAVQRTPDREAIGTYLLCDYFPGEATHLAHVRKLPPGHVLTFTAGAAPRIRPYLDPTLHDAPFSGNRRDAGARFRDLLVASVRRQRLADVPVGIFLSGGLDSSALTWAHRQVDDGAVLRTFTIAFSDKSFDESDSAARVAAHFRTEHHVEQVDAARLPDLLPDTLAILDEPLGDASLLPTLLLSRFARQHVKVALGGDGGDELFGGYPTYRAHALHGLYAQMPLALHQWAVRPAADWIPVRHADFALDFKIKKFLRGSLQPPMERHVDWMSGPGPEGLTTLMPGLTADAVLAPFRTIWHGDTAPARPWMDRIRRLDLRTYLAEGVLVKLDRATMAASLEARVPFLTPDLARFAFSLPHRWHAGPWSTKDLMRSALKEVLPRDIVTRRKKGFGVPMAAWLSGPLATWALDRIEDPVLEGLGIETAVLRRWWREHQQRRADRRKHLWPALVLAEVWRRTMDGA